MPDIIKLLPDSVANQIAAGEVIQRPASAVKELLENAVDSGADQVQLLVKDAGRTLIQVIDNGCGMSVTDARMSFERHATSKIKDARDLFAIRTLGFRGEALASIAAIAQVEMRSKRKEDELGTQVNIEGSKVTDQAPCTCPDGTNISVKNLFFNVPARRNFLKSNTAELRHITEEFLRVALVNPDIGFSMHANNKLMYQLKQSGLKERIVSIYGNNYKERLLPVEQESSIANIHGYVGKPEFARKTRGEQYFFVNNRFIKHPYLHHSVEQAYQELLPKETHASYFIFIETDPERIDINIHPTKTEVNFQDQQHLYAILKSAVRQALGKFSIVPSIDFDVEKSIEFSPPDANIPVRNPFEQRHSDYNPFERPAPMNKKPESEREKINKQNWEMLFNRENPEIPAAGGAQTRLETEPHDTSAGIFRYGRYIVTSGSAGIMLIDIRRAHERILYDRFLAIMDSGMGSSQQELFPQQVSFPLSDAEIIREIKPQLGLIGFAINELGKNTFVVSGIPTGFMNKNIRELLEKILENYKQNMLDLNLDSRINLARSMARNMAVKPDKAISNEGMDALISQLFSSSAPETSPSGKAIIRMIGQSEIDSLFK